MKSSQNQPHRVPLKENRPSSRPENELPSEPPSASSTIPLPENESLGFWDRLDHTLEDLSMLILSLLTFGVSYVLFVKRPCERSYIHSWYKYIDYYEHISEAEHQYRHRDD